MATLPDRSRPAADPSRRPELIAELSRRLDQGSTGAGRLRAKLRFWRKKYAWLLIVGTAKVLKRGFDVASSGAGLILLSPLFAVVAVLIKLTDGGPILFWQTRVGQWGREFPFPKFRSMVTNAEAIKKQMLEVQKLPPEERARRLEAADLDPLSRKILLAMRNDHLLRFESQMKEFLDQKGDRVPIEELHAFLTGIGQKVELMKLRDFYPGGKLDAVKLTEFLTLTFKQKDDPRVTWIGKIIRKFSIDELPQLWSVLKGDMSVVGPRPPVPSEVAKYTLADRRRLDAVPGLICIWQVSGRGDIPFPQQVQMDVQYINSQSFWMDMKLLLQAVPAVLTGKGAY
jgi:lipopolysaccharide/colanic/teichoic acid biosynthesis glycosyltransferase